ncbi:MAG: Alcohol dehydrogenase zinc-binding domain protein [Chthoniobacteraceae bacterium]|nr:Alcohol dehydrogenase zinc-binding domain protein [Chthoniobacteraceae bacterium]
MKTKAIVYRAHGAPSSVAHLEEIELPPLQPNQVRVRVLFAPINPADLNAIEGTYPIRPSSWPAVPGGEGAGIVEEAGSEVTALEPGKLVLLPRAAGSWCEQTIVPADSVVAVPRGIPPEQAAMLRVNPATAMRMLLDFVDLQPGEWIIQNAANSAVGRAVIQIAHARGLKTLNVVRRPELINELKSAGADAVLLEGDTLDENIQAATGGAPVRLGLNSVGGESALRLANVLAEGGTIVTFGAMGRQPLRIPNGLLIFNDLRWRGFWVSRWYEKASADARSAMFGELFALAQRGVVRSPVEKIYPLEEIGAALARVQEGGRAGKILLSPGK